MRERRNEQRLIEWNNDHTSSFLPISLYSLILPLYHHIQKMTKRAKSRSFLVLLMKNELLVRMLIMIIFLAPIGDWLVFRRVFLLARSVAQKDTERKEGKHNLFLARGKKRRQRREKDFLHIILTFSRSRRFLCFSLSLFLFLRSTRKNRLIVSFYKFPRLSSLVRRARSRRRTRVYALSIRHSPIGTHSLSVGIKKEQQSNITCRTSIPKKNVRYRISNSFFSFYFLIN